MTCSSPGQEQPGLGGWGWFCANSGCVWWSPPSMYPDGTRSAGAPRTEVCCAAEPAAAAAAAAPAEPDLWLHPDPSKLWSSAIRRLAESLSLQGGH